MSPKILELNFAPEQLPSTLEIVETAKDRFVLTAESLATLTESQLEWLNGNFCINIRDYQKLVDFRTDLIKTIDEDLLSMKTLQINSMADTNTVYSEINLSDDSILENEMPDVLSYFNQRIDSALEAKACSAQLSSNNLPTNILLDTNDSLDFQDNDSERILEAQPAGDNFKSYFFQFYR